MMNYSEDSFNRKPLLGCPYLYLIGIYCTLLMITALITNSAIINLYCTSKSIRKPVNIIIIILTVLNISGCIIQLPMVAVSAFKCRFIFGKKGCQLEAFGMFFIGCFSLYLLVLLSIERYYLYPFYTISYLN